MNASPGTYNPFYQQSVADLPAPKKGIQFSRTEVSHLAIAVGFLTLAFAYILEDGTGITPWPSAINLIAAFIAVGSGFILHELGHKVLAQRYGHWAEFRAQFMPLVGTLLLAVFTPFLFAAPGAVLIYGYVTRSENGIISIVGPAVNLAIALVAFPFTFVSANIDDPIPKIMGTVALVNAVLAVFNLLPFGPLDGKKVYRWNRPAWLLTIAASAAMMIIVGMRMLTLSA